MFGNKKNLGGFVFLSLLINFFYYNVKFKFQYKMFKNSTKLDKKNLYTIIQYYSHFNINFNVLLIILNIIYVFQKNFINRYLMRVNIKIYYQTIMIKLSFTNDNLQLIIEQIIKA